MGRIADARAAVLDWSRTVLTMRGRSIQGPDGAGGQDAEFVDTIFGDTGLVMTPAQAPDFFARSSSWRCTACGKVHVFEHLVPLSQASPARAPASSSSRSASSRFPGTSRRASFTWRADD